MVCVQMYYHFHAGQYYRIMLEHLSGGASMKRRKRRKERKEEGKKGGAGGEKGCNEGKRRMERKIGGGKKGERKSGGEKMLHQESSLRGS